MVHFCYNRKADGASPVVIVDDVNEPLLADAVRLNENYATFESAGVARINAVAGGNPMLLSELSKFADDGLSVVPGDDLLGVVDRANNYC